MLAEGTYKYSKLSLWEQYVNISHYSLAQNGHGQFSSTYFYWEFQAQPTPLSKIYTVLVICHNDKTSPDVFILDEEIWTITTQKTIPHLYDPIKIRLCLHYPRYKEWDKTMPLSETIIPWTYLWLFYYEEWLYSDNWKGGGKHPEKEAKKISNILSPLKKMRGYPKKSKIKDYENVINQIYNQRKQIFLKNHSDNVKHIL